MSRSTLILSVAVWLTMAATADARPDERTRPPARPGSEVATEGCVGPFSLAELDLYKEMEGARERLLATEARDLMGTSPAEWGLEAAPLPEIITPWPPDRARQVFLEEYGRLSSHRA